MTTTFTPSEIEYLTGQTLARLATIRPDGSPQNSPVAFIVDGNSIVIGGYDLPSTQKFRNLRTNTNVALVVDDIESVDPWVVRGVEIRGHAVAEVDVDPPVEWMSRSLIRIHPDRVISWGLNETPAPSTAEVRG
ncbi:MAG: PPOX class F420-dependent oxidoreductase [Acidimicrobiales bacterium]